MKPQLYSIVILLLTRIMYGQNTSIQGITVSGTQLPLISTSNPTSVAKPPDVTSVTAAPDDHKISASEPPKDVISVTTTPKGNTTSVTKTSDQTIVSEITTDEATALSEAPNSQATSAPSLGPVSLVYGSTSIGNQTSKPLKDGKPATPRINNVTNAVRKTTTKSTTGNRSSALAVPSLFAIVLLVVSALCF